MCARFLSGGPVLAAVAEERQVAVAVRDRRKHPLKQLGEALIHQKAPSNLRILVSMRGR